MKLGLFVNNGSELSVKTSEKFIALLRKSKIEYMLVKENLDEKCDVVVVFGGDGTTVRVIDYATKFDLPTLVINTGTLGFLSDFQPDELKLALKTILNGEQHSQRTLLSVECNGKSVNALNELVIKKKSNDQLTVIKLNVELNGEKVDEYFADGLIVATPTGSTAYSLSAGGSVITPDTNAFILTPICSHSFSSRPIIYNDSGVIKVQINKNSQAVCYADGKYFCELNSSPLIVKKSDKKFKMFLLKNDFFKRLNQKLKR